MNYTYIGISVLIIVLIVLLIISLCTNKKNEYYTVSPSTDYSLYHPMRSQVVSEIPTPLNVFNRIETTQPILPDNIQIKQKYNTCIQNGGTMKGCLTDASAGLNTNVCKELCHELVSPLSPYCTSVCTDQMYQQRNSCAGGAC